MLTISVILTDGSYLMVYAGTINEPYTVGGAKVPNDYSRVLIWATSTDGLIWKKEGIALDARNPVLEGFADGPDLVYWDDGSIRLYFWGYRGIYYSVFQDGAFSESVLAIEPDNPQNLMYPPSPPGDPTLINVDGV